MTAMIASVINHMKLFSFDKVYMNWVKLRKFLYHWSLHYIDRRVSSDFTYSLSQDIYSAHLDDNKNTYVCERSAIEIYERDKIKENFIQTLLFFTQKKFRGMKTDF